MNYVPPRRPVVVFDRTYRGTVGSFQTDVSYSVQYLQTSLRIDQLGQLSTAAEVLDFEAAHFDELIQRDIDKLRVRRIANEYLRSGQNRPIFFPPLIVCVGLLDEGTGRLRQRYEVVDRNRTQEGGQDALVATFDRNGFQLKLPVAEEGQSDRRVDWDGAAVPYYDFAAELAVNSQRTKLIVLDGQHRLEALRLLQHSPENRRVIQSIELPVCIVWSPGANVGDENIIADYRELFVRINSEPQRVSGHFLILLDDLTNTSNVVRELADVWKHEVDGGWSRLHLLEWNTRENERIDQRTRTFSITTISVIAKALREHLFKLRGWPDKALALPSRAADFAAVDPDFQFDELTDDRPPPALNLIVKDQIRTELVPALTTLFRQLRPYVALEAAVGAAFGRLQQAAAEPNLAYVSLGQQLTRFNYNIDDIAGGEVNAAYANFRQWARNAPGDDVFFAAVFQQGLIRLWLGLLTALDANTSAQAAAAAAVAAMNTFAAREGTDVEGAYLNPESPYCQKVLWKVDKINYGTEWAKTAWTNVLVATLVRPDVQAAALAAISDDADVRARLAPALADEGLRAARSYAARLLEEIRRDTYNNLGAYFADAEVGQLRELKRMNPREFEARILANARPRYEAALTLLANRLQRRTQDLDFPE